MKKKIVKYESYIKYSLLLILQLILVVNIINFIKFDSQKVLMLESNSHSSMDSTYVYSSSNIHIISFVFEYSNNGKIEQDNLGSYKLNNLFNVRNFDALNMLNELMGRKKDNGQIKLSLFTENNCVYLDCSSNNSSSEPTTISKMNLQESISFDNYTFDYTLTENENAYTIVEGHSDNDESMIRVYLVYK